MLAAASLTDAFAELGAAFEAAQPGTVVRLQHGSSASLREQVLAGAPGDVVATADPSHLDALVAAGAAGEPVVVASNELQLAVPVGNPAGVTGADDLAEPDLLVGLCAPTVPCGELGRRALAQAGVAPAVDTEAPHVRALLAQVASGDLDVGLVYRTDVLAAGDDVAGIDLPAAVDVVAEYPVATLTGSTDPERAAALVAFAGSTRGRAILESHGFGPP